MLTEQQQRKRVTGVYNTDLNLLLPIPSATSHLHFSLCFPLTNFPEQFSIRVNQPNLLYQQFKIIIAKETSGKRVH